MFSNDSRMPWQSHGIWVNPCCYYVHGQSIRIGQKFSEICCGKTCLAVIEVPYILSNIKNADCHTCIFCCSYPQLSISVTLHECTRLDLQNFLPKTKILAKHCSISLLPLSFKAHVAILVIRPNLCKLILQRTVKNALRGSLNHISHKL